VASIQAVAKTGMNGNGHTASAPVNRLKAAAPGFLPEPPHAVEAEQGILGSILVSGRETPPYGAVLTCEEVISSDHFYVLAHRTIYDLITELYEKKRALDLIAFTQELKDRNLLDSVGGPGFVADLFTFVPTSENIAYYIEIVRDKYILREIIAACTEAVRRSYEEQDNVRGLLDEVQAKVTSIALERLAESPMVHIKDDVPGVLDEFENAHKHRGRTQGLATGFVDLDRMTNGLNPGDMWVLAARPSMGKTALAMNIAEHVAVSRDDGKWKYEGKAVAVFSLETSRHRLVRRLICGRARISLQRMRDGHLREADFPVLTAAAGKFMAAPIYIDETPGLRLFEFKARARWAAVKLGVKLIVIDYLQLMKSGSKRAEFSRVLELTEISATIKEIGRELNIPIIAVAQLNREAEKQESGRPKMSHLRECGAVEQDADVIGLVYRAEYYERDEQAKKEVEGEAELIIAKHKDGPVGTIPLTFLKEFTRFESRTKALYSNDPEERQDY
jgi:replicative DNA helicase